jgi:hypothetical protein
MKFVVEDGAELLKNKVPQTVKRITALLDSLPDGTLLKAQGISNHLNLHVRTVIQHSHHPSIAPRQFRRGYCDVYYGNLRTIKEAKREFQTQ